MTKLSGNRLRMSSGEIRHFKSSQARENFEKYAQAVKHGWKPSGNKGYSNNIKSAMKK